MKFYFWFALIASLALAMNLDKPMVELSDARDENVDMNALLDQNLDPELGECTICAFDLAQDTELSRPPCLHAFHLACLTKWMIEKISELQSPNCPNCRGNFNFSEIQKYEPNSKTFRPVNAQERRKFNNEPVMREMRKRRMRKRCKTVLTVIVAALTFIVLRVVSLAAFVWPIVAFTYAIVDLIQSVLPGAEFDPKFKIAFFIFLLYCVWKCIKVWKRQTGTFVERFLLYIWTYCYLTLYFIVFLTIVSPNNQGEN